MKPPVNHPVVTSQYGWRTLNGSKQFHDGIDYVCDGHTNQSVIAMADGVVACDVDTYDDSLRWTDPRHSIGNAVILLHVVNGHEFYVRYCHLVKNYVKLNDTVKQGDILGAYGDCGYSFGPHVHVDAWTKDWQKVDITKLLEA